MDAVNQKLGASSKPERFIIRISDSIPPPPKESKTRDLAKIIDATTGLAEKSGSDRKIIDEAARKLWRYGTDPEKFEGAIKSSGANLSVKDKNQLLEIAGEIKKLTHAYPKTSNDFLSLVKSGNEIKITDAPETISPKFSNEVVMEKTARGIQVSPHEYEVQYYEPEDLEESVEYLDDFTEYAQNFDPQDSGSDYEEPESDMPSPQPSRQPSWKTESSRPRGESIRPSLSKGADRVVNEGKQLASRAMSSAQTAAKKAIRQGLSKLAASAGPALAQAGLYIAAAIGVIVGFFIWLATVIITVLVWMIGFVAFVVIILFIINSGAYMVPPGQILTEGEVGSIVGPNECNFETDCPCGWPVRTDNGMEYRISQGPQVDPSLTYCTHYGLEAIDVSNMSRGVNSLDVVLATHPGTITQIGVDYYGGLWLQITGTCNGNTVRSWHVHFDSFASNIDMGYVVERGTVLGIMGTTGYSTGEHDHYEFREGALMRPNFLPVDVPYGCCGDCNVTIP